MDHPSSAAGSDDWLADVIRASAGGIHVNEAVRDAQGTIVDFRCLLANPAACRMVNAPADWVGRTLLDCFPQARASGLFRRTVRVVETGVDENFDYRLVGAEEERWIRLALSRHGDGVTAIISDVTSQIITARDLEHSRQQLETHLLRTPLAAMEWDLDFRVRKWNPAAVSIFGWTEEEVIGRHAAFIIPDPARGQIDAVWQGLLSLSGGLRSTNENITKSGRIIMVEWYNTPLVDRRGRITGVASLAQDITERRGVELELIRTNRALKMLGSCNATLIRAEKEQALLEEICDLAVKVGGYRMAWVGYAQDDPAGTVQPMAFAGEEAGYLTEGEFSWSADRATGQGMAGRAIRSGQTVVSSDVTQDPSFGPWQAAAAARGYRSVIVMPLRDGSRVFGVIGLYSEAVQEVTEEEISLLQELADNLAFGITYLRARDEQRKIQAGVLKVAASVSASTGKEFFLQLGQGILDALGADSSFIARVVPGEPLTARTIAAVVDGAEAENFEYVVEETPCVNLLQEEECVIHAGVMDQFPRSPSARFGAQAYAGHRLNNSKGELIGLIFVIFRHRLQPSDFVRSTLRIFAARAASEMERQRTDSQIREQASLLDKARDAILMRDLDGTIRYWNKSAERLYGWKASETVGRSVNELYQSGFGHEKLTAQVIEFGAWTGEVDHVRKDGHSLMIEARLTLVRDEHGRPESILAINTDISERKKLEAQILRVQRMESIGTLAGGIAHDLNNVLTPILMSVNLLGEKVHDEQGRALLATLKTSSERGADLIKQVLSFARGVDGRRVRVELPTLVGDIRKIVRDTFPKSIAFASTASENLWPVTGDPTQLHQVLMNLCVNARDAMPGGGTLSVTLGNIVLDQIYAGLNPDAQLGSYVVIQVADSGIGIPLASRDKIFEPFYTTKEVGHGTGLGLSTSLAIVRSHGGFIKLYSEPGLGTTFAIYLPADTSGVPADPDALTQGQSPRGQGELVLLVDDEESIRTVGQAILEGFGYRVLLAENGAEALVLYRRQGKKIAVVLTDMTMPVMDGRTTILELKAINPEVRIIASSGLMPLPGSGAPVADVQYFISKPYTAHTLLQIVRQSIDEETSR